MFLHFFLWSLPWQINMYMWNQARHLHISHITKENKQNKTIKAKRRKNNYSLICIQNSSDLYVEAVSIFSLSPLELSRVIVLIRAAVFRSWPSYLCGGVFMAYLFYLLGFDSRTHKWELDKCMLVMMFWFYPGINCLNLVQSPYSWIRGIQAILKNWHVLKQKLVYFWWIWES